MRKNYELQLSSSSLINIIIIAINTNNIIIINIVTISIFIQFDYQLVAQFLLQGYVTFLERTYENSLLLLSFYYHHLSSQIPTSITLI